MKAVKYLVAGLLVMGLAAPAMAQDVNYKDALKPIETTLKAGNVDAKEFAILDSRICVFHLIRII